jgi:branched-chain amino acid transport system permease protein
MSSIRKNLREGLTLGLISILVVLLGVTGLVGALVAGWLRLSAQTLGAWLLLLLIALLGGAKAVRDDREAPWGKITAEGLVIGVVHGLVLGVFTWGMSALVGSDADVRKWLAQIYPEAMNLLTVGLAPIPGALLVFALITAASVAGALLVSAAERYHWQASWNAWWQARREQIVGSPIVQHRYAPYVLYGVGLLVLLGAPFVLDRYWNYIVGTVGIYIVLGLGLNIVVGMTGLLNLGYAAFFAIGAYTAAILTAPAQELMWSFWVALPVGILLSALTGVLLALPVLRMRGDYLAIVTLGFGEIIRILARSESLIPLTGGPRGLRGLAGPVFFGLELNPRVTFLYMILIGIALGILVSSRLGNSRMGRALVAMREDESVAQAVGVYTLQYKVISFAIGAAFAGFSGVVFAARNKFTGPEDFTLLVSVNVLSLVIIGGMNSIPGIVAGAIVLKGLPEILRELDDYRMLVFGALLVVMMILRPEGLWPSQRTRAELRGREEPGEGIVERGAGD